MTPQDTFELALCYYEGDDSKVQDYMKAYALFLEAAEAGHVAAQSYLGRMLSLGEGVEKDYEEAVKWLRLAAKAGDADAQNRLAVRLEYGEGTEQNMEEAVHWYMASAQQGYSKAQTKLGHLYMYGNGVNQDYEEALKWLRLAVGNKNPLAHFYLGVMYQCGMGVARNYAEAINLYKPAAENGHHGAMYLLGLLHYNGKGVEQNYEEAVKWYRAAAENGNIDAQKSLGRILSLGEGIEKNYEEAVKWLKLAAAAGDADAQNRLAVRLENGEGTEQNMEEAVHWYMTSAQQGYSKAQARLGVLYMYGIGIEQNYEEALKWLKLAAVDKNPLAHFYLGVMYECGKGVEIDYTEAENLYKLAAEHDLSIAMYYLGQLYYDGKSGEKNYEEAFKWYKAAADRGQEDAQCKLGRIYESGKGKEQNYEEALKWYKAAAANGNLTAMYYLGELYYNGKGVEQNYEEALKWYKAAAEKGDSDAQYQVGIMYDRGEGVKYNYEEAVKWYKSSASQGDKDAQFEIGCRYYRGQGGVKKSVKEAIKWFLLAAEQNHCGAQKYLGDIYQHGRDVETNLEEAENWYRLAIQNGSRSAKSELERLIKEREKEASFESCLVAAQNGDPEAQYKLANVYHYENEIEWYRLAAEQGHCEAQYKVAEYYRRGSVGRKIKPNIKEARKWYKTSAEQGHASAQYWMAHIHRHGLGVKQDYTKAVKWYRLSAEHSLESNKARPNFQIIKARYELAYMYEAGYGVEKNIDEAMLWYLSSADLKYSPAMRRVAQEKYKKAEYKEAYHLYEKADDADSKVNLAEMHLEGLGCEKDIDKAINLLIAAADIGSQQATYKLSQIYIGEYGTGVNLNEYVRNISRCKDVRSQLKLAELYFCGIHVEKDMYKTVRIWGNIARQGYKCVHYNLALAYYYGIGVDKDTSLALEYLYAVKDYDYSADKLLSILTGPKSNTYKPTFRIELNRGEIKVGSILEAEWKYINIKSAHINEKYNEEIKEIIEIYKANPSPESYFWLSRLYRELRFENNDALSELYFKSAIDAGHLYAMYINDKYDNFEIPFSEYDLYSPYYLTDILSSIINVDGKQISWDTIYIICRILQGYDSTEPLKESDKLLLRIQSEAKYNINIPNSQERKLYKNLALRDKEELRKEFIEYLWDILAKGRQDTLSFPCEAFYTKLNEVLADSHVITLYGAIPFNFIKYIDRGKKYYDEAGLLLYTDYSYERSEIEIILEIIKFYSSIDNIHICFGNEGDSDSIVIIPNLSCGKNLEQDLSACEEFIKDACGTLSMGYDEIKKGIILVNQEFCSSTKSKLFNSRVKLLDDCHLHTVISLEKGIFKDVPSNTYLLVLNMEDEYEEVKFITSGHELVVPYSIIKEYEYILNPYIYEEISNQSDEMNIVRLCDLLEVQQTGSLTSDSSYNISQEHFISNSDFHSSLLSALLRRNQVCNIKEGQNTGMRDHTYYGEYIFLKYENGIKVHIQDENTSSRIRYDIHALKIRKDAPVTIDYMAYILLSADMQTYIKEIADNNGIFMLSDLLYKQVSIHKNISIQKHIVEEALIKERQRLGSGVEYNIIVVSNNLELLEVYENTEGISVKGKNLTFEEIYKKYIKDDSKAIIDALIIDTKHDEYEDVMEEFGSIRDRNIHTYIISHEGDKAVKGKKKVEYFVSGNRIFTSDDEGQKKLINKLRDDLDSSNSHQAKIRMKYKDVFEAADALDKEFPKIGISAAILRYIQAGCIIEDDEKTSGPCATFREVCHELLKVFIDEKLIPQMDPGAIPSLLKLGTYYDNKAGKQYLLIEPFMHKSLSQSLEYFCKITNSAVHGSQDSSKLGTAALNILMEFIVWFYENLPLLKDIPKGDERRTEEIKINQSNYKHMVFTLDEFNNGTDSYFYCENIHFVAKDRNIKLRKGMRVQIANNIKCEQIGEREYTRKRVNGTPIIYYAECCEYQDKR